MNMKGAFLILGGLVMTYMLLRRIMRPGQA